MMEEIIIFSEILILLLSLLHAARKWLGVGCTSSDPIIAALDLFLIFCIYDILKIFISLLPWFSLFFGSPYTFYTINYVFSVALFSFWSAELRV